MLLSQFSGNPVSRARLVQELYPNITYDDSNRALDAVVRRLRHKLTLQTGAANPIKSAYGAGFCFACPLTLC